MSILTMLWSPPPVGAYAAYDDYWYNPVGGTAGSGVIVTADTALKTSTVWACVRLISETIASLPLVLYERVDEDTRRRAEDVSLYDILHDQPNSYQTSLEFVEQQTAHCLLRGNAFAEIEGRNGNVEALVPIHPSTVKRERLQGGTIRYRVRQDDGTERVVNSDDMFDLRGLCLSTDSINGISVIEHARESIGLAMATESYGGRFFAQDSTPGGVLEHPGKLSDEGYKRLKADWEARHSGLANAHRVAILEQGMKWHQMSMSNEDAQFLLTRDFQIADIARWFRVPAHMLGDTTKATSWGSGIEQLSIGFVMYTLLPWLRRWEKAIKRQLIVDRRLYAEFLLAGLLRGDLKSRYEAYSMGRQWGWLSVNDIRRFENMNPIAGGNIYWRPVNMTDASLPIQPAQPQQPAALASRASAHYQALVYDAAGRVIRKELAALGKAARRCTSDPAGWQAAIDEFYAEHATYVAQTMRIGMLAATEYVGEQKAALLRDGAKAMDDWETRRVVDLVALAQGGYDAAEAAA